MALAVDTINWCGLSNKMHPRLKLKKTNTSKVVLAANIASKGVILYML